MLFSNTFIENLVLLIFTALLSGFLIPFIFRMVDNSKAERQRESDAELRRQEKIIDAQSQFLDEITRLLWEWRYLAIKLTYYGGQGSNEKYADASLQYDDKFWDVISAIRNQISRSRRLISDDAYNELLVLYHEIVTFDRDLSSARAAGDVESRLFLIEYNHVVFSHMTMKIDNTIHRLATEMNLVRSQKLSRGIPTKL